jgi:hypothetical protein
MPTARTVFSWLAQGESENASEQLRLFLHQYIRAREAQADFLAEEIIEIADDAEGDDAAFVGINRVHRARLQIDTRKWIACKFKPKKYGDKVDLNHGGEIGLKQITGMEILSTPPKHEDKV